MKKIILFLAFILTVVFFPLLFQNKTLFFGDNLMLMIPNKMFIVDTLRRGTMPWWNPHIFSGVPFFADINNSLLYPSTVLFFFLSPSSALTTVVLFHLFWGAIGMACVSLVLWRNPKWAAFAALTWMLSPIVLSGMNNNAVIQSTSWVPWMMLCVVYICRNTHVWQSQVGLVLCVVLAFLGGHPYPLIYSLVFLGAFVVWHVHSVRAIFMRFFPSVLLSVCLLAFVLLPFLEAIPRSTRSQMSFEEVAKGSLHPAHILTLFVPHIFSDTSRGIVWGVDWTRAKGITGYVSVLGILSLVFMAMRWKSLDTTKRFFLSAGVVGLLYSFGVFLPLLSFMSQWIPWLRFIRSPGEAAILWVLCSSLLIGEAIERSRDVISRHVRVYVGILVVLLIMLCVGWIGASFFFQDIWNAVNTFFGHILSQSTFHTLEKDTVLVFHLLRQVTFAVVMFTLSLTMLLRKSWLGLYLVITVELIGIAMQSLFFAPNTLYALDSPQSAFLLKREMHEYRFLSLSGHLPWTGLPTYWDNMTLRPPFADSRYTEDEQRTFDQLRARQHNLAMNWGMPYRLSTPMGYGAFVLTSTARYWDTTENGASVNEVDRVALDDIRLNEQGVKYILLDTYVMSLQYILQTYPHLRVIEEGNHYAIVENTRALPIVRSVDGEVERIVVNVNTLSFHVRMKRDGRVFIAQPWYPGWTCTRTHGTCALAQVSGGVEVDLPQGEDDVVLRFTPSHIRVYGYITLASAFGMCVWVGAMMAKRGEKKRRIR